MYTLVKLLPVEFEEGGSSSEELEVLECGATGANDFQR